VVPKYGEIGKIKGVAIYKPAAAEPAELKEARRLFKAGKHKEALAKLSVLQGRLVGNGLAPNKPAEQLAVVIKQAMATPTATTSDGLTIQMSKVTVHKEAHTPEAEEEPVTYPEFQFEPEAPPPRRAVKVETKPDKFDTREDVADLAQAYVYYKAKDYAKAGIAAKAILAKIEDGSYKGLSAKGVVALKLEVTIIYRFSIVYAEFSEERYDAAIDFAREIKEEALYSQEVGAKERLEQAQELILQAEAHIFYNKALDAKLENGLEAVLDAKAALARANDTPLVVRQRETVELLERAHRAHKVDNLPELIETLYALRAQIKEGSEYYCLSVEIKLIGAIVERATRSKEMPLKDLALARKAIAYALNNKDSYDVELGKTAIDALNSLQISIDLNEDMHLELKANDLYARAKGIEVSTLHYSVEYGDRFHYLTEAREIAVKLGDKELVAKCDVEIAATNAYQYYHVQEYTKANTQARIASKGYKELNGKYHAGYAYLVARIRIKQGKPQNALAILTNVYNNKDRNIAQYAVYKPLIEKSLGSLKEARGLRKRVRDGLVRLRDRGYNKYAATYEQIFRGLFKQGKHQEVRSQLIFFEQTAGTV